MSLWSTISSGLAKYPMLLKEERVQVGILKNDFTVFSLVVISVETDPVLALKAL